MSQLRRWDNNLEEYDVTKASRKMNPFLKNYGKDKFTYTPEVHFTSAVHHARTEGSISHGYPFTAWMQVALVYACGLYTAKEQGIVKKRVFFQRYWRAHYFDWILFGQRSFKYAIVGGVIAGTLLFGDHKLAMRRIYSKYQYLFCMEKTDPKNNETLHFIKVNS